MMMRVIFDEIDQNLNMICDSIKSRIFRLDSLGHSRNQIGKILGIAANTVKNYLLGKHTQQKSKTGPKKKLKRFHEIAIKREFDRLLDDGQRVSARKISENCSLDDVCSLKTIKRYLRGQKLTHQDAKTMIVLTKKHKLARVERANFWIEALWPWHKVVWSDEKKFNLDGPDSWSSWMREDKLIIRNRRQQGGGSMQIWGMILPDGRLFIKELHHHSKATDYIQLLETFVKPTIEKEFGIDYIFMHDNAPTHNANATKSWMMDNDVPGMQWPSRSPDLNPIENIWAMLTHIVYDRKQFSSVSELRTAVFAAIELVNTRYRYKVLNTTESIQARLLKVIKTNGEIVKST